MKEIKDYIQFAIDNGYEVNWDIFMDWVCYYKKFENKLSVWNSLYETIISREFIEAIAKGILKRARKIDCPFMIWWGNYENCYNLSEIEEITIMQAIAIRDNKLKDFITNLLWLK